MEQFQLNPEQKELLGKKVEELAAAAGDLELEKGKERDALNKLKGLQGKLEKLKQASDIRELKFQLSKRNEIAKKIKASYISSWKDGVAVAENEDGFIFINEEGEAIFPDNKSYQKAFPFVDGRARVAEFFAGELQYYYIDENGEYLENNDLYTECEDFSEGFAVVGEHEEKYFIDKNGNELPALEGQRFEEAKSFQEGRAAVKKDGGWYFIDKDGNKISKEYRYLDSFLDGVAWGSIEGLHPDFDLKYVSMDEDIPERFKINEWYMIDINGNEINEGKPFRYTNIDSRFKQPFFPVSYDGRDWFYINKRGEDVFSDFLFINATPFLDGVAFVKEDGVWYSMNEKGEFIAKFTDQEWLDNAGNGYAIRFEGDGQYSLVDKNGKELLGGRKFDSLLDFFGDVFWLERYKKNPNDENTMDTFYEFVTKDGKEILSVKNNRQQFGAPNFEDGVAKLDVDTVDYGIIYVDVNGKRIFNQDDWE